MPKGMWLPESPQSCCNPHKMEEEAILKDRPQEETQTKDNPSEGDPSEKIHWMEADHLREDHPSEEDYLLAWTPNDHQK